MCGYQFWDTSSGVASGTLLGSLSEIEAVALADCMAFLVYLLPLAGVKKTNHQITVTDLGGNERFVVTVGG